MKALRGFVGSRPSTSSDSQPSTSAVFPTLRKLDLPMDEPNESPLLTLTLSAPSFLDVVVKDEFSDGPLYIVETHRDRTGIYRCETENITSVAKVQWPSRSKMISASAVALSGVSVQMHGGRWRPAEEFLKFGSLFAYVSPLPLRSLPFPLPIPQNVTKNNLFLYSSRKFRVPHHPHSLKWKRVGGSYTVRGPFLALAAHCPYSVCHSPPTHPVHLFIHQRAPGDPTSCVSIGAPASTGVFVAHKRQRCGPQPTQLWWSPTRAAGLPRRDFPDSGDRHRRIPPSTRQGRW